ncbi:MAG TPA: retropepsin-like aspartic protease [Methylomirabilota bacterium]|nr:retropepsin-like aspartic protease [Methylomirabilota bacterium]
MFAGLTTIVGLCFVVLVGWYLGAPTSAPQAAVAVDSGGPKTLTITTDRLGAHHVIRAALLGPSGHLQMASFIVDTGATDLVLPDSMIERLGFKESDLEPVQLQTAHGVVQARKGVLKAVQLGGPDNNDEVLRVAAVFLSEDDTGGYALMGMNVLGRYSITIEDDANQIILVRKH